MPVRAKPRPSLMSYVGSSVLLSTLSNHMIVASPFVRAISSTDATAVEKLAVRLHFEVVGCVFVAIIFLKIGDY